MVEISFPSPLVGGGDPAAATPSKFLALGAVLIGWPFFVARD